MIINIFGRRGSGKTTTIRGNIKYFKRPVVLLDILGNFDQNNIPENEGEAAHVTSISGAIKEIEKYHQTKKPEIIVLKTRDFNLAADFISAALWENKGGTLVIDEVDEIDMTESPCFEDAIRYGRNAGPGNGIHLITGCRRPTELGPLGRNFTAQANKFYCFGTHDIRDAQYFSDSGFGPKALDLVRVPQYSGLFLDYDNHTIGRFHIDINGNVFHDEETTA